MRIKALIVDDEYPAREELRYQLESFDFIDLVGEAATIDEAYALINALDYDLVFLDINFPLSNGIELGKEISTMKKPPEIVYITAYDQYAIAAFKVNAIDYLLKPISPVEFRETIDRVKKRIEGKKQDHKEGQRQIEGHPNNRNSDDLSLKRINQSGAGDQEGNYQEIIKISAEKNGNITLVDPQNIYFAYVEHHYVFIQLKHERMLTKYTLSQLEEKNENFRAFLEPIEPILLTYLILRK